MSKTCTLDTVRRVWNDDHGEHLYIGPDGDALGMIEIREVDPDGKIVARIAMTKNQALLVSEALAAAAKDLDRSLPLYNSP